MLIWIIKRILNYSCRWLICICRIELFFLHCPLITLFGINSFSYNSSFLDMIVTDFFQRFSLLVWLTDEFMKLNKYQNKKLSTFTYNRIFTRARASFCSYFYFLSRSKLGKSITRALRALAQFRMTSSL